MDFKRFFKNRNVIIILVFLILICICAGLTYVSSVFVLVAAFLSALMCIFFAYLSYVNYKNELKILNAELEAKGITDTKKAGRALNRIKAYCIGKIILFVVLAGAFISLGIDLL